MAIAARRHDQHDHADQRYASVPGLSRSNSPGMAISLCSMSDAFGIVMPRAKKPPTSKNILHIVTYPKKNVY